MDQLNEYFPQVISCLICTYTTDDADIIRKIIVDVSNSGADAWTLSEYQKDYFGWPLIEHSDVCYRATRGSNLGVEIQFNYDIEPVALLERHAWLCDMKYSNGDPDDGVLAHLKEILYSGMREYLKTAR